MRFAGLPYARFLETGLIEWCAGVEPRMTLVQGSGSLTPLPNRHSQGRWLRPMGADFTK
jgi:hypothetical protein